MAHYQRWIQETKVGLMSFFVDSISLKLNLFHFDLREMFYITTSPMKSRQILNVSLNLKIFSKFTGS